MALQLSRELPSGAIGDYWRIYYVQVFCNDTPTVNITMSLYIDRQARLDGKSPLHVEELVLPLASIDITFSYDFRACIYNTIKSQSGWESAIDIFDDPNKLPIVYNTSGITTQNTPVDITVAGVDMFFLPLTYSIASQPENGTVSIINNIATYTPNQDFQGSDSFTFIANNGTFDSLPGVVTVVIS